MTGAARFTLSLDCEGLWDMADRDSIVQARVICRASLEDAYAYLRQVLDVNGIRATCAFVSGFAAEPASLLEQRILLRELARLSPGWFRNILPAVEGANLDGWSGSTAWRALKDAGHEMGWHGATHLPLDDRTPADAVALELEIARKLFECRGHRPTVVVFPRNLVGHLDQLRQAGFDTYRAAAPGGRAARLGRAAREWNTRDERVMDEPCTHAGWRVSPAGHFLNCPSGMRRLVPVGVTVQRWRSLLRSAVDQGGYVHMWFHPHNLITAPAMRTSFEEIMKEAGRLVRAGALLNPTMSEGAAG